MLKQFFCLAQRPNKPLQPTLVPRAAELRRLAAQLFYSIIHCKACRKGFPVNLIKKIANGLAQTKFASKAINERADLSAFKQKPTARNLLGIFLMCCSYIIGWPAVGLIGVLSIYWREPLLIIIGAPLCLITAHLVFFLGMYLAGGKYVKIFVRWATRITLEKLM